MIGANVSEEMHKISVVIPKFAKLSSEEEYSIIVTKIED
jgi:hypothetical protein